MLIYVHLKQTAGLRNVIAKCAAGAPRRTQFLQDKTHATCLPSVFWSKPYFPPEIAVACWPGCQPECGPGLISFLFLPAESASQLLSSVYLFLLSPRVGCVKCYYRLLPLRFVSLTVTFTGNLIKNSSQAVLGGQSVCLPGASDLCCRRRETLHFKGAD